MGLEREAFFVTPWEGTFPGRNNLLGLRESKPAEANAPKLCFRNPLRSMDLMRISFSDMNPLLAYTITQCRGQFWGQEEDADFYWISVSSFSLKNLPSLRSVPLMWLISQLTRKTLIDVANAFVGPSSLKSSRMWFNVTLKCSC